jgi:hypothetical protein
MVPKISKNHTTLINMGIRMQTSEERIASQHQSSDTHFTNSAPMDTMSSTKPFTK